MRLIAIKANISLQVFEVRFADVDETRELHAWTVLLEKVLNFDVIYKRVFAAYLSQNYAA